MAADIYTPKASPTSTEQTERALVPAQASEATGGDANLAANRSGLHRVPAILDMATLQASLTALQANGADLRAPMRSRHQVQAVDQRTVDELMRWGRKQGFTMSTDRFDMHGGVQAQLVNFDRLVVPDAQTIQIDGLAIMQALLGMDTAEYVTWAGEINRR